MSPRPLLGLVWVVATVLATTVGFTATHTVGDVIRGAGPVGPEYRPASDLTPAQSAGPSDPRSKTFRYPAGQLTVQCERRVATLVDREPAPGWSVTDFESGPDEDIDVTFSRDRAASRIEVYCNEGEPTPIVSRSPTGP